MLKVRVQVKFRAFGITFGSIDQTFTFPIPSGALDILVPVFTQKIVNQNGVTLTVSFTK